MGDRGQALDSPIPTEQLLDEVWQESHSIWAGSSLSPADLCPEPSFLTGHFLEMLSG